MTDDEVIAQAVEEAKGFAGVIDLLGQPRTAESNLIALMQEPAVAAAVARHLLARDPECVRVPLVGKVPSR